MCAVAEHSTPTGELADVLARLDGVRPSGAGYVARCPCHEDREPSLSIGEGDDGRLLLRCFAGCSWEELRAALQLDRPNGGNGSSVEVARYHYLDEDGRELYAKIRFSPKRFLREPKGVPSSLYRLELLRSVEGLPLFLSESEKDVEALLALGRGELVAVSSGGSSTWREEWSDKIAQARPRYVAICEHHDEAGRKFAVRAAASLAKRGLSVRVLSFEGREGYDVADAIRDGLALEELTARAESAPEWSPTEAPKDEGDLLALAYDPFEAEPDEPSPWLWSGFAPRVGALILAMDSGLGKTWMMIEMGLASTTARALFGRFEFRGEAGPVLLLLEEDARPNVRSRVRQLVRGRYTEAELALARERLHVVSHSGIQLDTEEGRDRLRSAVERLRPVLVATDPMAEVHSRSENSADEMLSWLKPCRAMARELGFLLVLPHHTRKRYKTQDDDPKQDARGSSALKGWADTFLVARALGNGAYSVHAKQRYGTEDEPAVEAFTLHRDHNPETRSVSWRVSEGVEAEVLASADALRLLSLLRERPEQLRRELEDDARMPGARFGEALRVLDMAGHVALDDVRMPDRRGRTRAQKMVRLLSEESTGEPGTTGDATGDKPVAASPINRGQPRKGKSPVGSADGEDLEPQPGTAP